MADVLIYHPVTEGSVAVPEESVWHYRQSGWVTMSEWNEQQAAQAAAGTQTAPPPVAAPRAAKGKE